MEWRKEIDTPLLSYPVEILKKVAERLFLGRPSIGGKVDPNLKYHVTHMSTKTILCIGHTHHSSKRVVGMTGPTSVLKSLKILLLHE